MSLRNSATDAQSALELGDQILAELRKVNENLVGLCLAVRSNTGNQPAPRYPGNPSDSTVPTLESRTALAMEQLRRSKPVISHDKEPAFPISRPAQPSGEPQTRKVVWGLDIEGGEASMVLDRDVP
jgi:hypothetical protein